MNVQRARLSPTATECFKLTSSTPLWDFFSARLSLTNQRLEKLDSYVFLLTEIPLNGKFFFFTLIMKCIKSYLQNNLQSIEQVCRCGKNEKIQQYPLSKNYLVLIFYQWKYIASHATS